jgi:hypothetical protein
MVAAPPPTDAKVIANNPWRCIGKILMKKLLLASVFAIASFPGFAADQPVDEGEPPPARVTVTPPGPPPIGWVYGPYTQCANPRQCSMGVVNVQADGLNVRVAPNGPPVMALVNGTPLYPIGREGDWLLVAAGCDLTPTWAWSWSAGVPLNRCWVYF